MARADHSDDSLPPTVEEFLKTVIRSGLLSREQVVDSFRAMSHAQRQDSITLADYLVRSGKLSRFQARKLLKGISRGLILGTYQILALIGKGGMGSVYLCRDSRNGQLIALKVLPPHKAKGKERLLARFQREMELSQKVRHPHLCRTLEVGLIKGVHYLAMEFIAGRTLSKVISSSMPFDQARAARLMAEVASGLEHAHRQGLVHRDLKPGNIMITPHDHAKVLDLGLAMMLGEKTDDPTVSGGQGYVVGTMDYIAPEQTTDASNVDGRADIYSLGCTLYQTLAGRPPFPGGTSIEKIKRHRKEEPEPILNLRPDLQPAFAAVVHKMMAKDPRQRYRSAREIEEKLWLWAGHGPQLPLDSEEDVEFVEAIDALQREEQSSSTSWTDIEVSTDVPNEAELFPAPESEVVPTRWGLYLGLVGVGIGLLGGLILLLCWILGVFKGAPTP